MNNYQILGIKEYASEVEVKQAYKRLVKIHHPDKGGETEKFVEIQKAYQELINSDSRLKYYYKKKNYRPKTKGYFELLEGNLTSEGNFIFTFKLEDIYCVIDLFNLEEMYFDKGESIQELKIPKKYLKTLNYIVKIRFYDYYNNYQDKTYKIKKPLTFMQKIKKYLS